MLEIVTLDYYFGPCVPRISFHDELKEEQTRLQLGFVIRGIGCGDGTLSIRLTTREVSIFLYVTFSVCKKTLL